MLTAVSGCIYLTRLILYCSVIAGLAGGALPDRRLGARPVEKLTDGIRLAVAGAFLTVQVKTDKIVRVVVFPDSGSQDR